MTSDELREAANSARNALALTYTNVPADGSRPHWCRYIGHHDATCSGMLATQDRLRAAIVQTPAAYGHAPLPPEGGDISIIYKASGVITLGNRRYDEGFAAGLAQTRRQVEALPYLGTIIDPEDGNAIGGTIDRAAVLALIDAATRGA